MIPIFRLILICSVISLVSFQLIITLLKNREIVALNYRREKVPCAYGLVFTVALIGTLLGGSLFGDYDYQQVNRLLLLILTMSFVGIIDDLIGNKEAQGLVGHFKILVFKFKLTTGGLKALLSGIIIFSFSLYWYSGLLVSFLNGLIFLLLANFINLLDVRPGRALKVVILITGLLVVLQPFLIKWGILVLIPALVTLPVDLAGKGMMGDIGANVLGVVVGFLAVIGFSSLVKLIVLICLVLTHIYTEFKSLSNLINNNVILNQIDRLGRTNQSDYVDD